MDLKKLGNEYSLDFDSYGDSTNNLIFFTEFLLHHLNDFPKNLDSKMKEYLVVANKYAEDSLENLKELVKKSPKGYGSMEQLILGKKESLDIEEMKQYPKYVSRLGDIIYQAKYSPSVLYREKSPRSYFNFSWYVLAEEIVLSHAFFEGFLSKTIEMICRASNEAMKDFLGITDSKIDLTKKKTFEKQLNRLHRKIGGKSFERRLVFFNDHYDLKIPIDEVRKKGMLVFEQIRHIIVHNSGILDRNYVNKLKKLNFENELREKGIGKKINLDRTYAEAHRHLTRMFAIELFINVSRKYFGLDTKGMLK